jgi:small subunit ribosomal protein S16
MAHLCAVAKKEGKTMLKIRLKRLGAKKAPTYRIIVINSTTKREGKPVQELGHYNPKTKVMKLNKPSALDWIKKGAQPTETVKYLIDNCNQDGGLNYKPKQETKLSKKAIAKLEAEKEAKTKAVEEAKTAKTEEKTEEVSEPVETEIKAEEPAKEVEAPVEETKTEETSEEVPAE